MVGGIDRGGRRCRHGLVATHSGRLPFALEMAALRRMTHNAFGTLMALEPAFGQ
jgi:threonine/homoserine efflux transporter RhtA